MFLKEVSSAQQGCVYLINTVILWEIIAIKKMFSVWIYCKILFISVLQRCIFSIITAVFSVTWSSEIIIICSRNISDYYQWWKQLCFQIFFWKPWCILFFRILWWIERSKEQNLLEIEIFCNNINVCADTFDQMNASLLNNTRICFPPKYLTDPKLLNSVYVCSISSCTMFKLP